MPLEPSSGRDRTSHALSAVLTFFANPFQEMQGLVDDAADLTIATPDGALAALEWVRGECALTYADKPGADHLDVVALRFLDGALRVMRQSVEGNRA